MEFTQRNLNGHWFRTTVLFLWEVAMPETHRLQLHRVVVFASFVNMGPVAIARVVTANFGDQWTWAALGMIPGHRGHQC